MIAIFSLLLVGLARCQGGGLPSELEIEGSINRTINEVERLISEDPKLPRLNRQEIAGILYNITSKELDSIQNKETVETARKLYQRALMVVLPYNANDSAGSLKDLYTKPPVVKMISDTSNGEKIEIPLQNEGIQNDPSSENSKIPPDSPTDNVIASSEKSNSKEIHSTTIKSRYKNHRETYSDVSAKSPLKDSFKTDSAPLRFSFNLDNLQKNFYTDEKSTTIRPVFQRVTPSKDNKLEIIYSTSVTEESTTKSSAKEIAIDVSKTKSTSKPNQYILSSDQWRYNAPPRSTEETLPSFTFMELKKTPADPSFSPTTVKILAEDGMAPKYHPSTKFSKVSADEIKIMENEPTASIFVTPLSSTSQKSKYSSTYNLNAGGFRTETTSLPMRPEIMDLLMSIGLRPDNNTNNVEDVYKKNKDIQDSRFQIPDTNSVFYSTASGVTSAAPDSSIVDQSASQYGGSKLKEGMNNLAPDVQLLFQRFGLQPSNLESSTTTTTQRPTVNLNSYTNFKPLPASSVKDQEMKDFLARFGLGISDDRRGKAMTTEGSLIEAVPQNMRNILENIGLINSQKRPKAILGGAKDMESTETSKYHVFKPHEAVVRDEKQRSRINELLDTVKLVQEGKATAQDVQKAAQDLLQTTKNLKNGPDPLSLEEIIRTYNENVKNEVKREEQESDKQKASTEQSTSLSSVASNESIDSLTTTTTTTTTTMTMTDSVKAASGQIDSSDTATTISTTESSVTQNLLALEESFGGTTQAPDPVLPTRRKSGLYFLVDWNSFLEVGEEDEQRVNLRFQPKVGDRTRFIPIKVP